MSGDRVSYKPLVDAIGGLLSNPAVLEGLIAGASAIGASRKSKNDDDTLGGILSALPQFLPLISLFASMQQQKPQLQNSMTSEVSQTSPDAVNAADAVAASAGIDDAAADTDADADTHADAADSAPVGTADASDVSVSYITPQERREDLLLALRPFLSDSRQRAADAMVQVNTMSGVLFGRGEGGL